MMINQPQMIAQPMSFQSPIYPNYTNIPQYPIQYNCQQPPMQMPHHVIQPMYPYQGIPIVQNIPQGQVPPQNPLYIVYPSKPLMEEEPKAPIDVKVKTVPVNLE